GNDAPPVEHDQALAERKERGPVGCNDEGLAGCQRLGEALDELFFRLAVHGARRLIEKQKFARCHERAGESQKSALASRKAAAAFADGTIEPSGIAREEK